MIVEELESKLIDAGFDVKQIIEIDYGLQLKLANGSIVTLYSNKRGRQKLVLQGKEDAELQKLVDEINYDINYKNSK